MTEQDVRNHHKTGVEMQILWFRSNEYGMLFMYRYDSWSKNHPPSSGVYSPSVKEPSWRYCHTLSKYEDFCKKYLPEGMQPFVDELGPIWCVTCALPEGCPYD